MRSIEHGNLIDEATARTMKRHGAYLVPTLSTYAALADEGVRLGWSPSMLEKLEQVKGRGLVPFASLVPKACRSFSAPTCSATCTRAPKQQFTIRSAVQPPLEILQGPRGPRAADAPGSEHRPCRARGAFADLLLVEGDPERGLDMFAEPERGIRLLMQGGRVKVERLAS
ncbi:MAG: hypothetical protein U1F67_10505 [Rubrivivax sp.]